LLGEFLANEIGRDEFARRDLLYQRCYGGWTRQQHFARAAKKSQAVVGNLDDGVVFRFHVVLLFVAFFAWRDRPLFTCPTKFPRRHIRWRCCHRNFDLGRQNSKFRFEFTQRVGSLPFAILAINPTSAIYP
jgi:hypothetical protein